MVVVVVILQDPVSLFIPGDRWKHPVAYAERLFMNPFSDDGILLIHKAELRKAIHENKQEAGRKDGTHQLH